MVDKDAKMRDMKRQNFLLSSKIKLLEEEMENLHEKIDHTLKERNRLRKEVNLSINQMSEQILNSISASPTISVNSTQHNLAGFSNAINGHTNSGLLGATNGLTGSLGNLNMISSLPNFIEPFKTSSITSNFYTNPGLTSEWHKFKLTDPVIRSTNTTTNLQQLMNNNSSHAFDISINSFLAGTSLNNDYNSSNTTPRSFR